MSLILSPAPHVRTKNTTQRLMLNVVISLLPCAAAGIYYFGLRAAIVLAVSVVSAVLAELVWQNRHSYRTAAQAIGYKEFFPYFEQTATLEQCAEKLKQASRNYAKRQLT